MMSACAWACSFSKAAANFSSSPSVSEPISLAGSRCSANSITPLFNSQESASPLNWFIVSYFDGAHRTAGSSLRCLPGLIQPFNFVLQLLRDQIPLQLAVGGQETLLHAERLRMNMESAHLLVVGQCRVERVNGGLHGVSADLSRHNRRQITSSIPD